MRNRAIEIGQRFNPVGRHGRVFMVTALRPGIAACPEHATMVVGDDPTEVRLIASIEG